MRKLDSEIQMHYCPDRSVAEMRMAVQEKTVKGKKRQLNRRLVRSNGSQGARCGG